MRIQDLMSQPVHTCRTDQSVSAAAQLMWEHDCGVAPVVDGEGHLAGIITDRDICMAALFLNRPLSEIPIADVMAHDVATCRPGDMIIDAEHLMSARQVHRLPVVSDDGSPVGIVSLSDLARHARAAGRKGDNADLIETLAAISEPHAVAAH